MTMPRRTQSARTAKLASKSIGGSRKIDGKQSGQRVRPPTEIEGELEEQLERLQQELAEAERAEEERCRREQDGAAAAEEARRQRQERQREMRRRRRLEEEIATEEARLESLILELRRRREAEGTGQINPRRGQDDETSEPRHGAILPPQQANETGAATTVAGLAGSSISAAAHSTPPLIDVEESAGEIAKIRRQLQAMDDARAHFAEQLQALEERQLLTMASTSHEKQQQPQTENGIAQTRPMAEETAATTTTSSHMEWMQSLVEQLLIGQRAKEDRPRVTFKEEAETLTKFSGQDPTLPVKVWAGLVEELATVSRWSDYEKYFAAKKALTGAAEDWLASQTNITSWEELKLRLTTAFEEEVNPTRVIEEMQMETPKKDESLTQYMHRMRRKGSRGGLDDRLILGYIVDGIPDDARGKAQLYACKNFDELREAFVVYETVKRKMSKERTQTISGTSTKPTAPTATRPSTIVAIKTVDSRCFNCGQKGHQRYNCPSKGSLCFLCEKPGHKARECPRRSQQADENSKGSGTKDIPRRP